MIPICFMIGLAVGLFRGGHLKCILQKHFSCPLLLFLSLFCSALLASVRVAAWPFFESLRIFFVLIQYGLMLAFLFLNRRNQGFGLVMAGTVLNGLVILANGGKMPIGPAVNRFGEAALVKISRAPHYFLAKGSEPLLFLGDCIPLAFYMISAGDLFIGAGLAFFGFWLTQKTES